VNYSKRNRVYSHVHIKGFALGTTTWVCTKCGEEVSKYSNNAEEEMSIHEELCGRPDSSGEEVDDEEGGRSRSS
jgi:hypothetical protein